MNADLSDWRAKKFIPRRRKDAKAQRKEKRCLTPLVLIAFTKHRRPNLNCYDLTFQYDVFACIIVIKQTTILLFPRSIAKISMCQTSLIKVDWNIEQL